MIWRESKSTIFGKCFKARKEGKKFEINYCTSRQTFFIIVKEDTRIINTLWKDMLFETEEQAKIWCENFKWDKSWDKIKS